jgi:wyosine [tRNA(Phe)-imidazoG37] synthetase (radical SAM superfamily)
MLPLHESITYGPVASRRLGRSLGVNLLPPCRKVCTFNCPYCQYGWSAQTRRGVTRPAEAWPSVALVVKAVAARLRHAVAQRERIDRLTVAGHGEPTLHPDFTEIVGGLTAVRDELMPALPLAVLSNASTAGVSEIRETLARFDERYMKLDAGDAATLRSMNGTRLSIESLIEGLSEVRGMVIQAMFVKDRSGRIDNTGDLAVANWTSALRRISPLAVHLYTIDRAPAWPYLQPVSAARLGEIGHLVELAGIPMQVFCTTGWPGSPGISPKQM